MAPTVTDKLLTEFIELQKQERQARLRVQILMLVGLLVHLLGVSVVVLWMGDRSDWLMITFVALMSIDSIAMLILVILVVKQPTPSMTPELLARSMDLDRN